VVRITGLRYSSSFQLHASFLHLLFEFMAGRSLVACVVCVHLLAARPLSACDTFLQLDPCVRCESCLQCEPCSALLFGVRILPTPFFWSANPAHPGFVVEVVAHFLMFMRNSGLSLGEDTVARFNL